MRAAIITVGDELLNGQTVDTNSAWIAQRLNEIGVNVVRKMAVGDNNIDIIDALKSGSENSEIIIMTGGLGPTKDDITKKAISDFLSEEMTFSETTFERISSYFSRRKYPMTDAHRQQCYMPSSAVLIDNDRGTAPGMWIEKPNLIILSMPGVPHEMKGIMSSSALDKIKLLVNDSFIEHFIIKTAGCGETHLERMIGDIVDNFPEGISIAYLPRIASVKLRITSSGINPSEVKELCEKYSNKILQRVSKFTYGLGDISLAESLGRICTQKNIKIATAESCTGGGIAHTITSVAGSSTYFEGTVVSYSNDIKMNILGVQKATLDTVGAVSEETVIEMAQGVLSLLNVHVAVAVSGIAGPGGGTPDKPVGTIWMAICNKENVFTKKLQLTKDRSINIEYTIVTAINELRLFIEKNF